MDDGSDNKPVGSYLNIDLEGLNDDSTYDLVFMEEDGDNDVNFEWDFQAWTRNNKAKAYYSQFIFCMEDVYSDVPQQREVKKTSSMQQ